MLREQLNEAYKAAMKAKEQKSVGTLRLINAALKDRDIAVRPEGRERLTDDEILEMLAKMIRQRRESITLYEQGGRLDLVQQESDEIAVIERFLPKQMSEAEVAAAVAAAVAETGAKGIKEMGKVMSVLKERFAGQMDFGKASAIVKQKLSG
ncbi:MAG: GatB/YqeY domain-containing protein [Alphaproteobacteria bacterium]|nr:GatB/YqeY domain-containing protein [Alphaproteobacteria bacterium]